MYRKFVWPTKHPPIAWPLLCLPKEDGGMGLKNLCARNNALLTKTLWNIHSNKQSLWIRWLNQNYRNCASVWQWEKRKDDSPLIKQLTTIRDTLLNHTGSADNAAELLEEWFNTKESGLTRAYAFFIGKQGRWPWKPIIWKHGILPKHRFILWLLAHRKLMTRDRKCYIQDKRCVLCSCASESIQHLFFQCPISWEIWKHVRDWLGLRKNMGSAATVLKGFQKYSRGEKINVMDTVMKIKIHSFRCTPNALDDINSYGKI